VSVSSISFWQQDRNFWSRSSQTTQQQASEAALITEMGNAITTQTQGLSSIANQTALNRVNSQLSAALQAAISGQTSSSSSTSTGSSSSSSSSTGSSSTTSSTTSSLGAPAVGTGTAPLTLSTPLFSLGIVQNGSITVSDSSNTTTYQSTGSDTVGDLINAINMPGDQTANVTAWLNDKGDLVVSGNTTTDTVSVGGIYAANLGFGNNNNTFSPTPPTPPASSTSTNSSSSTSSSSSSSTSSSSSSTGSSGSSSAPSPSSSTSRGLLNSALALQTGGTAEILLASNGLAGSLLNLLA
jgi:hypothetical protein